MGGRAPYGENIIDPADVLVSDPYPLAYKKYP